MASKYLQKYPVPAGFQQILADFTREVLRDQPPNIIQYASKYFEMLEKGQKFQFNSKFNVGKEDKKYELAYNPKNAEQITKKASNIAARVNDNSKHAQQQAQESHAPANKLKGQSRHSYDAVEQEQVLNPVSNNNNSIPQQMIRQIQRIFNEIDVNKNGFIQSNQVRKAIEKFSTKQPGLKSVDQKEVQQFIKSADSNYDGKVGKAQFTQFMKQMLWGLYASAYQAPTEKTVNQQEVDNYMNSQQFRIASQELRDQCNQIFDQFDADHNGYITTNELQSVVQAILGATNSDAEVDRNEIKEFMEAVDSNRDGKINREQLFQFVLSLATPQEAPEQDQDN